jgi:AcrR family transcriptional regulator
MSSEPVTIPSDDERPYHHGDLRQALIDTGVELAREGGPDSLVLREAARRLGVSRTAAYRHFANYDELVGAVKRRALTELGETIQKKLESLRSTRDAAQDARRRLVAVGECYLEFAFRESGLFRVAFGHRGHAVSDDNDPSSDTTSRPFDMLARALDELVEVGLLSSEDRTDAEIPAWAAVHGLAMLCLDGPLSDVSERARQQFVKRTLKTVLFGLIRRE